MSGMTLEALRAQGADRHDPVRFRYLEALAARMAAQPAPVRQVLARRLEEAVEAYSKAAASASVEPLAAGSGLACTKMKTALPLLQLNRYIAQRTTDVQDSSLVGETGSPSDMKSVRRFAELWAKVSSGQQLAQALTRGPELAGPLNSHNLMLRAMSLMHGLSPDYLRRFLAQAEALLWVEGMNQHNAIKDGKPARRGRVKRP